MKLRRYRKVTQRHLQTTTLHDRWFNRNCTYRDGMLINHGRISLDWMPIPKKILKGFRQLIKPWEIPGDGAVPFGEEC